MRWIPVRFAIEKNVAHGIANGSRIVGNVKVFWGDVPGDLIEVVPDGHGGLVAKDTATGPSEGPGSRPKKPGGKPKPDGEDLRDPELTNPNAPMSKWRPAEDGSSSPD